MPDETNPVPPATVPLKWFLIAVAVALISLASAGFSTYSWKQEHEKFLKSSETDKIPMLVGGKIVYRTITKTQTLHDKTVTTIKSGCTLGLAISSNGAPSVYLAPDLLGFGPGNIQILGLASKDELIGGVGYRLNF